MPNVKSKIGELPSLLVFIPPAPAPAPAPCSCCCCWWCWWWLWWVYSICILYLPWNSMATSGTSSRILWWVGRVMIRIFGHGLLNYHHLVGNLTVSSTYDMMSRSFEFRSGNHLHKNSLCELFAAKSSAFRCQELQLLTDSLTRTILTLARQGAPSSRKGGIRKSSTKRGSNGQT